MFAPRRVAHGRVHAHRISSLPIALARRPSGGSARCILVCAGGRRPWSFESKRRLVTGASRGLGAALAQEARGGRARGSCWSRGTARRWSGVAAEIRDGGRARRTPIAADVGDKRARPRASPGAAAALVGPDRRCSSTTRARWATSRCAPLLDTDCEDLEEALEVNLVGPFRLTKLLAGSMVLRGRGRRRARHLGRGRRPRTRRWGAYGVSKAALDHLGRIWARSSRAPACASSPSTRARWTRGCTPTRCPTPTARRCAPPERVAARIVAAGPGSRRLPERRAPRGLRLGGGAVSPATWPRDEPRRRAPAASSIRARATSRRARARSARVTSRPAISSS